MGASRPTRARGLKFTSLSSNYISHEVAPHTGAWIEMSRSWATPPRYPSRPTRARGLKSCSRSITIGLTLVAPHTGAWIEMLAARQRGKGEPVAPHTGAWIEIILRHKPSNIKGVAPHTGAWIEIRRDRGADCTPIGRAPHGRVD